MGMGRSMSMINKDNSTYFSKAFHVLPIPMDFSLLL